MHRRTTLTVPLMARVIGHQQECAIHEVSNGGFSVTGPVAFVPDAVYEFQITTDSRSVTDVTVTCRYCREQPGAPASFLAGFQFVPPGPDDLRAIMGAAALAPVPRKT